MRKIVAIDGNEANISCRVGVNVYAYEIIKGLHKLQDVWKDQFSVVVYLKEKPLGDLPQATPFWQYRTLPSSRPLWILTKLMPALWLSREKPAVLFSPSHYTAPLAPCPTICSIMDLGYLNSSEQFTKGTFWQLKYWSAISIFRSKLVLAISNATKEDIVRHYPSASKKTMVTYLGFDEQRFNTEISDQDVRRIKNRYDIVDDYILYLGTLKPSKNVEGLLRAFQLVVNNRRSLASNLRLVIVGKKGWMYEQIYKLVHQLKLGNLVTFTDFLPEVDKPALLKGAQVLVSPSFWEGFGLHVLESMACGTPVVASNRGSFPEIVEEAGVLVDPTSVTEIAGGIRQVLALNQKEMAVLKEKMELQAKKFTWEKASLKTLDAIKRVIDVE